MGTHLPRPRYDEHEHRPGRPGIRRPDHRDRDPHSQMEILTSPDVNAGSIFLESPAPGGTVVLSDDVYATVSDGRLTAVEILNLSAWGDPFDEAAAAKVLEWVREQLATRAAE